MTNRNKGKEMNIINGIYKETLFQRGENGMPDRWIVHYWEEGKNPLTEEYICRYCYNKEEVDRLESMDHYADWYSSQEIPLAVQ